MTPRPEASVVAAEPQGGGSVGGPSPDDAGWRCPVCGQMAGAQDLDDDPELPCWDCQQGFRESWLEYVRESA